MTHKILRLPAVLEYTGLSRSTIYAKIAAGQFPPPVALGLRAIGFKSDQVEEWVRTRESKRCL
jgi:prophage regulatory protein